ncbi:MAG: beta-lactamase family protein [Caldilineaceae bacterium]|nr:beta-lactamase family protein [Caldilineaceae bacterium]
MSDVQRDDTQLQEALVTGVAMGLPGISVALGNGTEMLWSGTAGYDDISRQTPIEAHTRFGIGSITKTFVAVVIQQLAGEGKLDLDATTTDYVKLPLLQQIPNVPTATLRQLLNHTSGIPTWEFQPAWIRRGRGDEMVLGHRWDKLETLAYITDDLVSADFAPGASYAYSNTNYTLLGLVVEAVTGNEVTAEIRQRILEPLGMEQTFMESFEPIPGDIAHHYHYATPTFVREAGIHRGFPEIRPYIVESTAANLSPEWAAGGMVASAADLVRFARALRDGKLLSPAMQAAMFTYHPPQDGGSREYMQGIARSREIHPRYPLVGHSGGTLGFSTRMHWLEGIDLILVVMTNIGGMHSGLTVSPTGLFYERVILPAAVAYAEALRA